MILWAWTAVLSGFVLYPLFGTTGNAVIPFGVVVLGLVLYTLFHPGLRKDAVDGDGTARATGRSADRAAGPAPARRAPAPRGPALGAAAPALGRAGREPHRVEGRRHPAPTAPTAAR